MNSHVRIPVKDVLASRDWYARVLGLVTKLDLVEEGALTGVTMADESGGLRIGLRLDPARARSLAGFEPIAIAVGSHGELEGWRDRFEALGVDSGPIDRNASGSAFLLTDPNGIGLRFFTGGE